MDFAFSGSLTAIFTGSLSLSQSVATSKPTEPVAPIINILSDILASNVFNIYSL